ncbi:MAG: hypothetical protein IT340_20395 [Chloroflexi bacterium]|nr:hypothetical protein [Chloroflexota bacterium]
MSDVPSVRLPFGTVAAVFPSTEAAAQAATALDRRGYPRALVSVLTGTPWQNGATPPSGFLPDPELGYALMPATPADAAPVADGGLSPALAQFAGTLLTAPRRRSNPARTTAIAVVIGLVVLVVSIFLFPGNWLAQTILLLVVLQAIIIVAVLAYIRREDTGFPFRERIADVDAALEHGGALVTVRCTPPYTATVTDALRAAGGDVLGYAQERVYPLPA